MEFCEYVFFVLFFFVGDVFEFLDEGLVIDVVEEMLLLRWFLLIGICLDIIKKEILYYLVLRGSFIDYFYIWLFCMCWRFILSYIFWLFGNLYFFLIMEFFDEFFDEWDWGCVGWMLWYGFKECWLEEFFVW